jgi:hypothetical protein
MISIVESPSPGTDPDVKPSLLYIACRSYEGCSDYPPKDSQILALGFDSFIGICRQ